MDLTDEQNAIVDAVYERVAELEAEDDMELPFAPDYDYTDSDYFADDADYDSYIVTIDAPRNGRRLTVTISTDRY